MNWNIKIEDGFKVVYLNDMAFMLCTLETPDKECINQCIQNMKNDPLTNDELDYFGI